MTTAQVPFSDDAWPAFQARLRGYVRRRVDPASVDDVVGSVLLRLVQHQDDLLAARNPAAWALRVAANAVTDHHRRRATERRALSRAAQELETDHLLPKATTTTDPGELARCLIPMIRALPARYSEALLMTEIEGLTQSEAAKRLGLSTSGMKSRIRRGREKLKHAVLRCCEIQVDHRGAVLDYQRRADPPTAAC